MVAIRLSAFVGTIPIRQNWLLPEANALEAVNLRTGGGSLLPVNTSRTLAALNGATRRVYRIPTGDPADLGQSFWWQHTDPDTDVVRTPIVNDSYERFYWASPSGGLRYATKAQILAGNTGMKIGVVAPTAAMGVTPVAGTGELDPDTGENVAPRVTRSYVATFVSIYGEESQPSPPREATGHTDQDWLLDVIPQPVAAADRANIQTVRIYRTVTAASGTATFFKVVDLSVGTTVYTDRLSDSIVTGQGEMESTIWAPPPDNLQGIIGMPNGIIVGWFGNTLCFSENYRPHAWPVEYQITTEYPIVGLGVFGNTCVVCTRGNPAAVTGVKSANMNLVANTTPLPCVARGSIVSTSDGVVYASDTGLVLFGPAGIQEVTKDLIGRYRWSSDFAPATLRAAMVDGGYAAVRRRGSTTDAFMFFPLRQEDGVVAIDDLSTNALPFVDVWSGRPLIINANQLREWLPSDTAPRVARWRSKQFQFPRPCNLGAAEVFYAGMATSTDRFRLWADGRLVYDQPFRGTGKTFRLPDGFMAEVWQVELQTSLEVHSAHLASTVTELRNV